MTLAHPYPTELLLGFASLPRRDRVTVAHVAACGRCKLEVPLPSAGGSEAGPAPLPGHALTLRNAGADAEAAFAEALRRRPERDPLEEALYCRFLAGRRRSEKRVPEALALLGRAVVLFQEVECVGQEIAARNDLGVLLLALGEHGGAFDALLRAFLIAEAWMSLDVALRCRGKLARCALDLGRLDTAHTLLQDRAADERRASRGVRAEVGRARSAIQERSAGPQAVPGPLRRAVNGRGDEVLAALAWISALVEEYAHGRGAETVRPGGRV